MPGAWVVQTQGSLIIEWKLDSSIINLADVTDVHVYMQSDEEMSSTNLNQIQGYTYLGRSGDPSVSSLEWYAGNPRITKIFKNGPQIGSTYRFRIYVLTMSRNPLFHGPFATFDILFDPTYVSPTETPIPTLIEQPSTTKTPTPTPLPVEMHASEKEEGILIQWTTVSDPLARYIHLYVQVENGMQVSGTNKIENYYYLSGKPASENSWLWKENSPATSLPFRDGPLPGYTYRFRIYVIAQQDQKSYHYGPFAAPETVIYRARSPKPSPTPEQPSPTPFPAPPEPGVESNTLEDGLLIFWNLDLPGIEREDIEDIHIYVKINRGTPVESVHEIDGFYYFGRTGNGEQNGFLWRRNTALVAIPFREGPQEGIFYTFRIYALTRSKTPLFYGPFTMEDSSRDRTWESSQIPTPTITPTVTPKEFD